jgi:hypothetical protein
MLAVKEAKQLLESAKFDWLDEIYTYNVPKNEVDNTDNTVALIRDVNTISDLEGNDDFFAAQRQVEIQFFYKLEIEDTEQGEYEFLKLFKKNHWHVTQIREHSIDPDTKQVTGTFYFTQLKIYA